MNETKSQKWITSGKGKALVVNKVQGVFGPVAKNPCNLISIFGRARQGKSFLMNCLAGEREVFKISNEKDSCTQGIDISNKWLNLSEFSKIDGGKLVGGRTEGIKVGFVDAEGQGDKDVSYDANLICPILLASKCVIFNWKGDLQKDHILSTLGIMARAAQNIAAESTPSSTSKVSSAKGAAPASEPKFGHLHIIFRDWQAVRTDDQEVFSTLLDMEGNAESATRDIIRKDLLASFESIQVWLFDAPSELTRDLRQKLTFDKTSVTFRAQLRALREALALQLKEPTYIAGHALTGRMYGPLTEQIAEALNSGQAVLPSSAYLNMMRQEALQLVQQYGAELRAQVQELLGKINLPFVGAGVSSKASGGKLYPTRAEADAQFTAVLQTVGDAFQTRIEEVTGNVAPAPGSIVATILKEYNAQVETLNAAERKQFATQSQQQFAQWLMRARKAAEQMLDYEIGVLEKKLPMSDADLTSPLSLTQQLASVHQAAVRVIGGAAHYGADCAEVVDAEHILQRHFAGLSDGVLARNTQLLETQRRAAQQHVKSALASIEEILSEAVAELVATRPTGYLMKELEQILNGHYHSLNSGLEQTLQHYPERAVLQKEFTVACAGLRGRMVEQYDAAKERALRKTVAQADDAMAAFLQSVDLRQLWSDTPLEDCEFKLNTVLDQLSEDTKASLLSGVEGWLLGRGGEGVEVRDAAVKAQMAREEKFQADLAAAIQERVHAFREECAEELGRLEQERLDAEREAQGAVNMTADEDAEEEEEQSDEEEDEEMQDAVRGVSLAAATVAKKGKSASSTAEQRRRAAEWAEKEFGAKKPTVKARSKKAPQAKPNVKSVEQQRADALAYAKKLYGEHIGKLSPPTKPAAATTRRTAVAPLATANAGGLNPFSNAAPAAIGRKRAAPAASEDTEDYETAEEGDEMEEAAPVSAKGSKKPAGRSSKASKLSPAAQANVKLDPVKAARQEAQRQAEERVAAAASAAASRAERNLSHSSSRLPSPPAVTREPAVSAPPAAAPAADGKIDPVKAARLEAQRLAAERAAAAASSAASRADKAKAKKSGGK